PYCHSFPTRRSSDLLEQIDAGRVTLEITRIAADCWFRMPQEFTMIAKVMLNLDRVVHTLAPDFDPNAIIRDEASKMLTRKMAKSIESGSVLSRLIEVKEFV